ncbi:MAG: hypothetical protein K6F77_00275 [Lachnospiraceae bacterium]|nr:hypothetical protein [Lachnospiraceae bacterium]
MKITKDMKKALSALLAAALVVTGAPVQNAQAEEPTEASTDKLGDNEYKVVMTYCSGLTSGHVDWGEETGDQGWDCDSVVVDMDNLKESYELSYKAAKDAPYLGMGIIEVPKITDATQVAEFGGFFKLVPTAIKVNDTKYAIDYNVNSTCYKDGKAANGMRWNLVNEYNSYCTYDAEADKFVDIVNDEDHSTVSSSAGVSNSTTVNNVPDKINVTAGDTVSYVFTVENVETASEETDVTSESAVSSEPAVTDTPESLDPEAIKIEMEAYCSGSTSGETDWAEQCWNGNSITIDSTSPSSFNVSTNSSVSASYVV